MGKEAGQIRRDQVRALIEVEGIVTVATGEEIMLIFKTNTDREEAIVVGSTEETRQASSQPSSLTLHLPWEHKSSLPWHRKLLRNHAGDAQCRKVSRAAAASIDRHTEGTLIWFND